MRVAISCEMDYLGNPQMCRSTCNQDYVEFVSAAGDAPYIVCVGMDVEAIADDMDGLLLSGGKDISPLLYGADLEWCGAKKCNIVRDIFERELYTAFLKRKKPIFGICRGFQLIALFSNDELKKYFHQDINKLKSVSQHHQQSDVEITGDNPVHVMECRGVLEKLVGRLFPINSFHHQGFVMEAKTGDNAWLQQCEDIFCWGRSRDSAKILEAFGIIVNETKVAGVQYHPERMLRGTIKDREKHLALYKYTMGSLDCDWAPKPPEPVKVAVHNHGRFKHQGKF